MTRTGLREKGRIDMTSGPLFPSIIKFILPLIATNLLQQVYHAADIMVVGLSPEADAVGAVGDKCPHAYFENRKHSSCDNIGFQ